VAFARGASLAVSMASVRRATFRVALMRVGNINTGLGYEHAWWPMFARARKTCFTLDSASAPISWVCAGFNVSD